MFLLVFTRHLFSSHFLSHMAYWGRNCPKKLLQYLRWGRSGCPEPRLRYFLVAGNFGNTCECHLHNMVRRSPNPGCTASCSGWVCCNLHDTYTLTVRLTYYLLFEIGLLMEWTIFMGAVWELSENCCTPKLIKKHAIALICTNFFRWIPVIARRCHPCMSLGMSALKESLGIIFHLKIRPALGKRFLLYRKVGECR